MAGLFVRTPVHVDAVVHRPLPLSRPLAAFMANEALGRVVAARAEDTFHYCGRGVVDGESDTETPAASTRRSIFRRRPRT